MRIRGAALGALAALAAGALLACGSGADEGAGREDGGTPADAPPAIEQTPPAGVAEAPAGDAADPAGRPAGPPGGAAPAPGSRRPPAGAPGAPGAPGAVAPAPPQQDPPLRGRVGVSGTAGEPITTVAVEGSGPLIVQGVHETDLRTLAGAVVEVRGAVSGARRRVIDVTSYHVVEIDGQRPVVGTILPDGRLAAGSDTLTLVGASPELRPGDRAWVVGERTAATIRVSSAGRIGVR